MIFYLIIRILFPTIGSHTPNIGYNTDHDTMNNSIHIHNIGGIPTTNIVGTYTINIGGIKIHICNIIILLVPIKAIRRPFSSYLIFFWSIERGIALDI